METRLIKILQEIIKEEEQAFHGTSHNFKCFRTAGIGGGSGAQAYGWGLYFGKDVDIAKGLLPVWDPVAAKTSDGYRIINTNTILSAKIGGKEYEPA